MSNKTSQYIAQKYSQGKRFWYTVILSLREAVDLLTVESIDELPVRERMQRLPVKSRAKEVSGYMENHRDTWLFPPITASFSGSPKWAPFESSNGFIGTLSGSLGRIFINDGQHRILGIGLALEHNPDLGAQQIAVNFTKHKNLFDAQNMFSIINGKQRATPKGLNLTFLHDEDNPEGVMAQVMRNVIDAVFPGLVEEAKGGSVGRNSAEMFSNVSLMASIERLISQQQIKAPGADWSVSGQTANAVESYQAVKANIKTWQLVEQKLQKAADVRASSLISHGNFLRAVGEVLGQIRAHELTRDNWESYLAPLQSINLDRMNPELLRRGITGPGADGSINAKSDRQARDAMVSFLRESLNLPVELAPTKKTLVTPEVITPAPVVKITRAGMRKARKAVKTALTAPVKRSARKVA